MVKGVREGGEGRRKKQRKLAYRPSEPSAVYTAKYAEPKCLPSDSDSRTENNAICLIRFFFLSYKMTPRIPVLEDDVTF